MPGPYTTPNGTVFHGVVPGALATIELTRKDRLHTASIIYTRDGVLGTRAEMENDIEYIEYLVGSAVQRKIYVSELFNIADEKGETVDDGYIDIDFAALDRRTIVGEDISTLNLEVLAPVTFRVKLATQAVMDTVGTPGESPGLDISLLKTDLTRDNNGKQTESQKVMLSHVRKQVQATSTEKVFEYEGSGRAIQALRFMTDKITYLEIEIANRPVQKMTLATLQHRQKKYGLTPQTDMVTILGETLRGRYTDGEILNNLPLRVTLTLSAAETFDAVIEEMGAPIS